MRTEDGKDDGFFTTEIRRTQIRRRLCARQSCMSDEGAWARKEEMTGRVALRSRPAGVDSKPP